MSNLFMASAPVFYHPPKDQKGEYYNIQNHNFCLPYLLFKIFCQNVATWIQGILKRLKEWTEMFGHVAITYAMYMISFALIYIPMGISFRMDDDYGTKKSRKLFFDIMGYLFLGPLAYTFFFWMYSLVSIFEIWAQSLNRRHIFPSLICSCCYYY